MKKGVFQKPLSFATRIPKEKSIASAGRGVEKGWG